MGILKRIFGNGYESAWPEHVRFGRYSDAYKPEEKYDAWDRALVLFENHKYLESYELFFYYLLDEDQDNVKAWQENGTLRFEVLQGSMLIFGEIGKEIIKAEARIASTDGLNIGLLRRVMELNYKLKYSRYALDPENNLTLLFDSYLLDGSPYKMYYALKEIAVSADKQDDLLLREFESLKPIKRDFIRPIPPPHSEIKLNFIRDHILAVFDEMDSGRLNQDQYSGAFGYVLLDLVYRIDYLTKPEGTLTEALERIHRIYFEPADTSNSAKNAEVRRELDSILKMPDDEIKGQLYNVSSSFGITTPGNLEQLISIIDNELHHMDWYVDNRHYRVALAFPGYITGYALFNYSFELPIVELLRLYYHITEARYFTDLGFHVAFYDADIETLDKRLIMSALKDIRERYRVKYPRLKFDFALLSFDKLVSFAKSYFIMIRSLDLTKVP